MPLSDDERRKRSAESARRRRARKRGEQVPYMNRGGPLQPLLPRVMAKIQMPDDSDACWIWTGARITVAGYGRVAAGRVLGGPKVWNAHRVTYTLFRGPIPDGLDLDHLCRNRICVNPDHLEPVTRKINTMRSPIALTALNARKTACNSGHEYTPANTYNTPQGYRHCRACHRINMAAQRAKKKDAA